MSLDLAPGTKGVLTFQGEYSVHSRAPIVNWGEAALALRADDGSCFGRAAFFPWVEMGEVIPERAQSVFRYLCD